MPVPDQCSRPDPASIIVLLGYITTQHPDKARTSQSCIRFLRLNTQTPANPPGPRRLPEQLLRMQRGLFRWAMGFNWLDQSIWTSSHTVAISASRNQRAYWSGQVCPDPRMWPPQNTSGRPSLTTGAGSPPPGSGAFAEGKIARDRPAIFAPTCHRPGQTGRQESFPPPSYRQQPPLRQPEYCASLQCDCTPDAWPG